MEQEQQEKFESEVKDIKKDSEEKDYKDYAKKLNLEYVNLKGYPISPDVLNIIPKDEAVKYRVISYLRAGNKVKLATPDPQSQKFKSFLDIIKSATKFEFLITITSPFNIAYALKLYDLIKPEVHREEDTVDIKKEDMEKFEQKLRSLREIKENIKKVSTTRLLDFLLAGAVKTEATDIHLEAAEKEAIIRYRIDGVLHPIICLDLEGAKSIVSRIKFLAKLKLDTSKLPQDGKFFITSLGSRIDIRVSTLPEVYGESIVLRLFDKEASLLVLEELGLGKKHIEQIKNAYQKNHGLIFASGPTGSGKTTTLYGILDKLNKSGVKIITLEDPIEYDLPGIIQSQVNPDANYTFPVGMRSILRQDPDILLVGEIRDLETAEMAMQASLTGHLVLTTLHTNDAPSAIHRLIDIGVRTFLIVDAINLIIAQRLVRKVCPKCEEEYKPDKLVVEEIKKALGKSITIEKLSRGKGCDYCNHTGFKGRIGIFELLELDDNLKELTLGAAALERIKKAAAKSGMKTMEQDGLEKALQGITTPEEVWRVVRE